MQGHRARLLTCVIVNDWYWTRTQKQCEIVDNCSGTSVHYKRTLLIHTLLL